MNVDETEKAALCIAVHHRQYPSFSSIHIHTPFMPIAEKSENVFGVDCREIFELKGNVKVKKMWKRNK